MITRFAPLHQKHHVVMKDKMCNNGCTMVKHLRIRDEDYLFFGTDPFGSLPDKLNFVRDLNTGSAYRRTWHKFITKPGKQILLHVIFYIDAANTGHFADLPITAVKISLGIFTRKARNKDHFWRILGYIPAVSKHKSRG